MPTITDLLHEPAEDLDTAAHDLDRVDDRTLIRHLLDSVQVGKHA